MTLTGYFTGLKEKTLTDVLIVGKVSKSKIEDIIDTMSKEFLDDINYTIMDIKEFNYRKNMADKFLYNILKNKKIVVIDKMGVEGKEWFNF